MAISNNPEISQAIFLGMRERWQPCVDLMPFFDFCAGHVHAKQPFSSFGNYVFNPGRPLALCILYVPKSVSYAGESEKSLLSYCLRHDYTAYIYRSEIYSGIHPTWHKARVLLNHLGDHRGIVWVDADTLFLKQDRKVFEPFLSSPKSLHICKDFAQGISSYNAGVFFFQNAPWSKQVLEDTDRFAVEKRPPNLWDHGSDQKVMCDIILQRDPQANSTNPTRWPNLTPIRE
jgi:hypothetical protein